jgi:tetratricopeptide (TPR) repeat protein
MLPTEGRSTRGEGPGIGRAASAGLVAAILLVLAAAPPPDGESARARKAAQVYGARGRHDKAVAALTAAIASDRRDAAMWNARGLAFLRAGDVQKALADFGIAVLLQPEAPGYLYNRAQGCFLLRRYEAAIRACSRAIALDGRVADYWDQRARAHFEREQPGQAILDSSRAIELQPAAARFWTTRGMARHYADQLELALGDYSKAIDLAPGAADYRNLRALVWARLGKTDLALAEFARAIELSPATPLYWKNRADLRKTLRQWEKARADYTVALRLAPKDALLWEARGALYAAAGRWRPARADFDQAIRANPQLDSAWNLRGVAHVRLGKLPQAVADYSQAIALQPGSHLYRRNRGAAQAEGGKWVEAAADLSGAVALGCREVPTWSEHALLQWKVGGAKAARQACSGALAVFARSEDPFVAQSLLWICLRLPGTPEDGTILWPLARRMKASHPDRVLSLKTEAVLLYRTGRYASAAARWKEALDRPGAKAETLECCFLAMTHYRLGKVAEARDWMAKARAFAAAADKTPPKDAGGGALHSWQQRLDREMLLREAGRLLGGPSAK